jgi:hypothetical protein
MFKVPNSHRLTKSKHPHLGSDNSYGNNGFFVVPHHRIADYFYNCMASDGEGWEHVSITLSSTKRSVERCPTWEEMCHIKSLFWSDDDIVLQLHPAKADYVNNHPYCLHLWRPVNKTIPVPDSLLVGIKESTRDQKTISI